MRSWMIAFSLGVLIAGFVPQLPPIRLCLLLLIIPLLAIRFGCLRQIAGCFLGALWFLIWAITNEEQLLEKDLEQKDIWVMGSVANLPQLRERSQRIEFEITHLCPYEDFNQCQFDLYEKPNQKLLLNIYQEYSLRPGQNWQFKVRLKRPHGFANPGVFDYEVWLRQKEIMATGYVRNDPNNRETLQNNHLFNFDWLRFNFREKLKLLYNQEDTKNFKLNENLIKALTIGDRYNITDKEWKLFSATGTNHLVVISGLHVGLVALMVYRICVFLVSIFTSSLLCIPAQRLGAALAVLAAFFYAGLAGFSLPAQRAFIMVGMFMLAKILNRHSSASHSFGLALVMILLLDPLAPQGSGFWLSFCAVACLLHLANDNQSKIKNEQSQKWRSLILLIKTQGYLFIGLMPLMLIFFQQLSLLAPLVNIIAIPFISLLVVPLCLLGLLTIWFLPVFAKYCFMLADFLLSCFKWSLEAVVSLAPNLLIEMPELTIVGILTLVLIVIFILFSTTPKFKLLAIVLLLPLFMTPYFSIRNTLGRGQFIVSILDVGQGLALVISTQQHHLIYDTGPSYSPSFNAGSGLLIPYLRAKNINDIDRVIISHGDSDHIGGLTAIAERYPNAFYLAPDPGVFNSQLTSEGCRMAQQWQWDEVSFEILHPDEEGLSQYSKNNASCVLKVSTGAYSVLLSGDIEKAGELRLLAETPAILASDILIAPHHGSNTSSIENFIAAVSPQYTVFSSGYLSRFNHPHPLVVSRYQKFGVSMLNTAHSGEISFQVGNEYGILGPKRYRQSHKRYWSREGVW